MSDPFGDVRGYLQGQGFGALGGEGAEAHHGYKTRVADDNSGVSFTIFCDNCGQPNVVTPSWAEFVYGMNALCPPGWQYSERHRGFHPNVGCRSCNGLMMLIFRPDECARHVRAGVASRAITDQQVAQLSQRLRGAR